MCIRIRVEPVIGLSLLLDSSYPSGRPPVELLIVRQAVLGRLFHQGLAAGRYDVVSNPSCASRHDNEK